MKKLAIFAFAAMLVVMFVMPAAALESQFGGYWRTRAWTQQGFTGADGSAVAERLDKTLVDTRTRLYYTAIFHENLKFVNKFEFDADWGDQGYGDIGADGVLFEIKNTYADFNLGPVNAKIGTQYATLARGFLFADDFSGAIVTFKGETFDVPVIWIKAFEGGAGQDANDLDVDYYAIAPSFKAGGVKINPYFMYGYSKDVSGWNPLHHASQTRIGAAGAEKLSLYYAGLDLDATFDMFSVWFTGIYEGGSVDFPGGTDLDVSAWIAAIGGKAGMSWGNVHGQFFYATGDDPTDTDNEINSFFVPSQNNTTGQSYYWSEIMGLGIFDDDASNNSPFDKISNIMAANLGVTAKPMDKLSVTLDVWYAAKAEDITTSKGNQETSLGTEVDLVITYQLLQGLNLDVVGAYLFAGDATTMEVDDDANPYLVGSRLSLSF